MASEINTNSDANLGLVRGRRGFCACVRVRAVRCVKIEEERGREIDREIEKEIES